MRNRLSFAISTALLGAGLLTGLIAAPVLADEGHAATAAPARPLPTTQLPRTVRPLHYQVEVTPHADQLRFDGKVAIDIEVLQPTDAIVLNALDLQFGKVSLAAQGGRPGAATKIDIDPKAQTARFAFGHVLAAGRFRLALD
jgi:aminopeptidase N